MSSVASGSPGRALRWLVPAGVALAAAACAWLIGYLLVATPGSWFSGAPPMTLYGAVMKISRGTGQVDGGRLVIPATDAEGLAIISIDTPVLKAADYRRARWTLMGGYADVEMATLWRTDEVKGKVNSIVLEPSPEGAQAWLVPGKDNWSGNIEGVALAIRGKLRDPIIIESVTFDPMGVKDMLGDRARDWLGFIPWNGLSINTVLGGPQEQRIWFTLVVALVGLTAIVLCLAWRRWGRGRWSVANAQFPLTLLAIVAASWILLDARWLWTRLNQTEATAAVFAGKSMREKHIADVDGYLYAFAEQVRLRLPKSPARVYVTADDHYFGARMAYHLYPHNAYYDHGSGVLPPAVRFKPGEYVVVFRRHGVQYDVAQQSLRWDTEPPVRAQMLLAHKGNALFKLLPPAP